MGISPKRLHPLFAALVAVGSLISMPSSAQQPYRPNLPPFVLPDDVSLRKATIMSDGSRLAAQVYTPKTAAGKLPTIIMAVGWGGTMDRFPTTAAKFAQAGYLVVLFDYRGWGESEGRVVLTSAAPPERGTHFTAEVTELREIRDPKDDVGDLFNIMHWIQAEPQADTNRIGLWGTSWGGGVAAYVAGYDHRVKAVHAQVSPLELRVIDRLGYSDGVKRARGELDYPKPGLVVVGDLLGAPITEHFIGYSPATTMQLATDCALQVVLAGNEQLFDVKPVIAAFEKFPGAKKNLVTIPDIGHYDIYGKARDEADRLALAWFDKNLK
jgi:pimeloyl-ACP methyl ester carboxylesterase